MFAHVLSAVVGAVIAVAGAGKITNFPQWRRDAANQGIWAAIALVLPALELVLGSVLVVLRPHPVTLGAATLLLIVFTVYLAVRVASKSTVPCACFGSRSQRAPGFRDIVRNAAMIALLFIAAATM